MPLEHNPACTKSKELLADALNRKTFFPLSLIISRTHVSNRMNSISRTNQATAQTKV